MKDIERISMMLNVIHEENKSLAEMMLNLAFNKDTAEDLFAKIRSNWDEVFNLAAIGEYDENGKLVYAELS